MASLIDPVVYYGDREAELAMRRHLNLFGESYSGQVDSILRRNESWITRNGRLPF